MADKKDDLSKLLTDVIMKLVQINNKKADSGNSSNQIESVTTRPSQLHSSNTEISSEIRKAANKIVSSIEKTNKSGIGECTIFQW